MLKLARVTILFMLAVGDDGVMRVRKRSVHNVEGDLQSIFMIYSLKQFRACRSRMKYTAERNDNVI